MFILGFSIISSLPPLPHVYPACYDKRKVKFVA
uniref:Uncharacterized protein n=1 Tax=Myoviridae sp. ct9Fw19 TaxID=2826624 RepID=A0A8S5MBT5_9CAUD|nr:MAG TPA: hypothetical protein [Myoviridae sp. ct9Fw19]